MKNKILFLLLMITTALSWSLEVEAQTTCYVLDDAKERSWGTIGNSGNYNLNGPGATLTFEAKRQTTGGNNFYVAFSKDNGKTWEEKSQDLTTSYKTYTYSIDAEVTTIRFLTKLGATLSKYVKNVKVTRATTLTSSTSAIDFGKNNFGTDVTRTISVDYNNTYSGAKLTGTCDNTAFSVTETDMGETGSKNITVIYTPTALGQQTGTVTLTMGTPNKGNDVTTTFTVSGIGTTDYFFSASTGVNRSNYGSASVKFENGNNEISVLNTPASSVEKTAKFTATANTGYEFVGWGTTDNATSFESVANPYNLTLTNETKGSTKSKTLYAIFKPVFEFSATATSSNGTLGTATATVANDKILGDVDATQAETTASFIATPADDCVFKGWYEASDYSGEPVSTNANYNVTLTNSTIGSTATKTLYALFKKKQNLQWEDPNLDVNLVNGQDYSSAATVTSGKTITYTSDNHDAVTIDADGTIHAVGLGDAKVTASVPGDAIYQAETITRDFSVGEIKQATFTPAWGEGTSTDIKVDGSTSIALTNIANDETFTISASPEGIISWNREGNTLNISAVQAGTTTLTLSQQGSAVLAGNQVTYTITVSKYPNTFALADETKAMKVDEVWENVVTATGNGNTTVSYSVEGVATYDAEHNKITALAEGSTVITFAQEATANNEGTSKTINVTVTKVVNTLSVTLGSTEMDVEGTINLVVAGRVSDGATHAVITEMQLSSEVNNGTDVITYNNNVITACNAGTAKIKFTQDATAKYTAYESETYTITVNKISNAITVTLDGEQKNSKNVGRGATVAMSLASTSGADDFQFTRISGTDDIATISSTSIMSGQTDGTSIWEISQAETYKYAAATTTVRVKVNSVPEEEGYVYTGWTDGNEYSWSTISGTDALPLSGPGETFTFQAKATAIASFWNSTNFYAQYSTDGGNNWTNALTIKLSDRDKWYDFSCTVPENATHVRLITQTGATGNKQVRNLKVTRKTYVRATVSQTNLGEVYTDKTASTTFNVSYSSTNGGNIEVLSNNPRFSVDKADIPVQSAKRRAARDLLNETESITVTDHSDNVGNPVVITVTYTPDPEHLGDDAGTITISDRYYSAELTFTAFAKKYPTTISRGSNTATETTVDGTIDNAFAFTGTSASAPTADGDDDFYYTIASTYSSDVHTEEGVITYDPATNTITGRNAGTARLTIYQKSTNLYAATSQTFDFTVSKLANPVNIALSSTSIEVDGTATVALTNDDGKGAVSVAYSNIAYTNEALNREGGLLAYNEETKVLTGVNAGTATVTVTQAETYKYVAKSQQFMVTVSKLPQTLTWDHEVETTMQVGAVIDNNTATSAAGLTPVTYTSSNTAAIEVDAESGRLTAKAVGANITITATQAGNYKYAPATITRQFSVFNKKTPAFTPDEAHYDSETKTITVDWEGTATITVTSVGADAEAGFTITNGNDAVISVVRNDATITMSGLTIGNTTLTLTQAASDDFLAKTETYTVNVVMPTDYLTLDPAAEPTIQAGTYRKITLNRTLKAGYSTIALPFDVTVAALVGDRYNAETDWVAQLSIVAYNAHDGYSLYFKKSPEIVANEPYILHLANALENPVYTGSFAVVEATTTEHVAEKGVNADGHSYADWAMHSNYTPGFDMQGKYGVVNADGCLKMGGAGATLSAFGAYINYHTPASSNQKVATRFVSDDELAAIIEQIETGAFEDTTVIYDLSGRRMNAPRQGVIIKNGRKTWNR